MVLWVACGAACAAQKARMLIVNDAGHFHYREHPKEFARKLINFISNR
jgi:pimeloyl-ACP methyl ester carboxylesterase